MNSDTIDISKGKILLLLPLFYNTVNFLYCLYSGSYTGDYLGVHIEVSHLILLFNYICSFIPFVILWKIYIYYKKKNVNRHRSFYIKASFFKPFVYFIFFWQIIMSLLFGVGQLGDDAYDAPAYIKLFIQIFNRFPANWMGAFYIALYGNKRFSEFIKIALLIIIAGLVKKSISSPIFVFYIFLVFYGDTFLLWIKKHILLTIISLALFPCLLGSVYTLRDYLRGNENQSVLSVNQLIFGKFFGRLSSFSDSSFIIQNLPYFAIQAAELDTYYYQRQILSGTLGMSFAPDLTPEKVLFNSLGDGNPNVSYMCGVSGNMILALLKSPFSFFMNVLSFVLLLILTFSLANRLNIPHILEIAFIFQMGPVMSGVANECAFVSFVFLLFIVLIVLSNNFLSLQKRTSSIL